MEGHGIVWNLLSLGAAGAFATSRLLLLSPQASPSARNQYTHIPLPFESDTRALLLDRDTLPRRLLGKRFSFTLSSFRRVTRAFSCKADLHLGDYFTAKLAPRLDADLYKELLSTPRSALSTDQLIYPSSLSLNSTFTTPLAPRLHLRRTLTNRDNGQRHKVLRPPGGKHSLVHEHRMLQV
jgi:hypothetical protein